MLGNGRLEAMCIDGIKRLCHIRGKMRKKVWVNTVRRPLVPPRVAPRARGAAHRARARRQGDIVLVGLRDYQDEKADVILKCAAWEGCQARALHVASACGPRVPTHLPAARRYMADEARSLKAYGELPENSAPCLGGRICQEARPRGSV